MKMILSVFLFFILASADAALIDRGGGFIYDGDLDITWMQNANINGFDSWNNQTAWVNSLNIVDTRPGAGGVIYSDWRLPKTLQPDANCSIQTDPGGGFPMQSNGTGCTGSEMGHLYSVDGIDTNSPGPFTSLQGWYWSGTEYTPDTTNKAWNFNFGVTIGAQNYGPKYIGLFAWAVRDGDVAAVVPVPAAVWLFGSALLGLLGLRRASRVGPSQASKN